jgi:hypothetical protein
MKFLKVLPLLLAALVTANDDQEKASGALRGSTTRDIDQSVRKAQAGFVIPTTTTDVVEEEPVEEEPVEEVEEEIDEEEIIEATNTTDTEDPIEEEPVPVPVPVPRPTLEPVAAPTYPPVQLPPIRQQNLDVNGNACGMSTPGTVMLHGGIFNYDSPRDDRLGQRMITEMRTDGNNRILDPFVFLPGARRDVSNIDEREFENQWRNIMAPGVPFTVLHADNREPDFTNAGDAAQSDTDAFVRPLKDAMGVFLPGGRQWRLVDAYKYTQTEEELWNVLKRGGMIAGTSAGAAAIASYMPRGDPAGSGQFIADREWYRHGFGFVNNIAVDNHVMERGREEAMYELFNRQRATNRKMLGIGLNENTMARIKGTYMQVQGDNGRDTIARVYDCSGLPDDVRCDADNAPPVLLERNEWYDLCQRRVMDRPPQWQVPTDLDEDLGLVSRLAGAYQRPWSFGTDFKSANPNRFLCSGRRCTFKSSEIIVNSRDGIVRMSGRVNRRGNGFRESDQLVVRYRTGYDPVWKSVYDSNFLPSGSPYGGNIFYALQIPPGRHTIEIEIEGETSVEGEAEWSVENLKVE